MLRARLGNASFVVTVRFPTAPPHIHIRSPGTTGGDTDFAGAGGQRERSVSRRLDCLTLIRAGDRARKSDGSLWSGGSRLIQEVAKPTNHQSEQHDDSNQDPH